ncbi:phage head morphogenesis protein [Xylella fastidiosa subsp. multiplex]|uniref:phage head morphogenesis protein n=1 Tax=Xylella fastidiosa TaxID=2371 RepID=UPI0035D47350
MLTLPELLRLQGRRIRKRQLRPPRPSRHAEATYRNALLALVRVLHQAVGEQVLPVLNAPQPGMTRDAPDGSAPQGHLASQFMQAIEAALLRAALRCGGLPQWAERIAAQQVQRVDRQVVQTIGSAVRTAFGIDITSLMMAQDVRTQIHAARAVNVQLITSIQRQYFDKIGMAVLQGVMQGKRASALAKEIEQISDATASRAKFIARDQTSKMNAAFNEIRQVGLGIESYTWQTSADERVREDHAAHDGTVFRWSDPPATGHPGQDYNCRCVAIPNVTLEGP